LFREKKKFVIYFVTLIFSVSHRGRIERLPFTKALITKTRADR